MKPPNKTRHIPLARLASPRHGERRAYFVFWCLETVHLLREMRLRVLRLDGDDPVLLGQMELLIAISEKAARDYRDGLASGTQEMTAEEKRNLFEAIAFARDEDEAHKAGMSVEKYVKLRAAKRREIRERNAAAAEARRNPQPPRETVWSAFSKPR
jgi:hypothetical protein